MILKGSKRGGARQLAAHLLRDDDNDHVRIHELRGFMAEDLSDALHEAYAVSRGTRARQFLFSLSLNPPPKEIVPMEDFERAIDDIEAKLGLKDQPRAIVFHEKDGRRHAHAVWSRIDAESMTAISMPFFKNKLKDVAKQLYIEHGWQMPRGFIDSKARDPAAYSREEYQQAKRAGADPKALKMMFQELWATSDSKQAFASALEERGYHLARGDRRGYVAVDFRGEVYAIAKWIGKRAKDVRARLGDPNTLPTVADVKAKIASRMTAPLRRYIREADSDLEKRKTVIAARRNEMVTAQRAERLALEARQARRADDERQVRASRLRRGLRGLWDRLLGRRAKIEAQNERETAESVRRDHIERDALVAQHLAERRELQSDLAQHRAAHCQIARALHRDLADFLRWNHTRTGRYHDAEKTHVAVPEIGGGRARSRSGPEL